MIPKAAAESSRSSTSRSSKGVKMNFKWTAAAVVASVCLVSVVGATSTATAAGGPPSVAAGPAGKTPANEDANQQAIEQAIKDSFVSGFRAIMLIAAAMALASTFSTWLLLEKKSPGLSVPVK